MGLVFVPMAGLLALHGSEPGQVRKEAAKAILCKCRGSGSPPPPFFCETLKRQCPKKGQNTSELVFCGFFIRIVIVSVRIFLRAMVFLLQLSLSRVKSEF